MQSFEQTSVIRPRKLYRSADNRVFAGICGGLAEHFGISPNWLRAGFIWSGIMLPGVIILAYIACIFFIPLQGTQEGRASRSPKRTKSRFRKRCCFHRSRSQDLHEQYALVEDKLDVLEELLTPRDPSFVTRNDGAGSGFGNREQVSGQYDLIEEKIRSLEDLVTSRDYVLNRKFEDL